MNDSLTTFSPHLDNYLMHYGRKGQEKGKHKFGPWQAQAGYAKGKTKPAGEMPLPSEREKLKLALQQKGVLDKDGKYVPKVDEHGRLINQNLPSLGTGGSGDDKWSKYKLKNGEVQSWRKPKDEDKKVTSNTGGSAEDDSEDDEDEDTEDTGTKKKKKSKKSKSSDSDSTPENGTTTTTTTSRSSSAPKATAQPRQTKQQSQPAQQQQSQPANESNKITSGTTSRNTAPTSRLSTGTVGRNEAKQPTSQVTAWGPNRSSNALSSGTASRSQNALSSGTVGKDDKDDTKKENQKPVNKLASSDRAKLRKNLANALKRLKQQRKETDGKKYKSDIDEAIEELTKRKRDVSKAKPLYNPNGSKKAMRRKFKMSDNSTDYLIHYGVPGMSWRQHGSGRRWQSQAVYAQGQPNPDGKVRGQNEKRPLDEWYKSALGKDGLRSIKTSGAKMVNATDLDRRIAGRSTQELKEATSRLKAENDLKTEILNMNKLEKQYQEALHADDVKVVKKLQDYTKWMMKSDVGKIAKNAMLSKAYDAVQKQYDKDTADRWFSGVFKKK